MGHHQRHSEPHLELQLQRQAATGGSMRWVVPSPLVLSFRGKGGAAEDPLRQRSTSPASTWMEVCLAQVSTHINWESRERFLALLEHQQKLFDIYLDS
jgi:hypothetical protein